MLLENRQQLHLTFFKLYIYQGSIQLNKDLQKQLCHTYLEFYIEFCINREYNQIQKETSIHCFITYFSSLMAFKNKFYCIRISINSFVTHFYSIREQILMHEGNCQIFCYIFLDFCSSQEQTLMFHHFLE